MDPAQIAIVAAAFFFAAFVKGATGLGFSTTAIAPLALALGLKTAIPLLLIPSLASNLLVMRDAGHFRATVRRFWPLYLAAVPGVLCGLALLVWVDGPRAGAVLGAVLALYALYALRRPDYQLAPRWQGPAVQVPVGLATGTINGLTGSQVMPVLPYLMGLALAPDRFVQAINCSFTLSSLVMLAGLGTLGLLNLPLALVSALGIVPVWLGVRAGGMVRRHLSEAQFRRAVLVLLLLLGASLIARILPL